eukprot:14288461-Ditylum_brightwellii.AAC.1
MGATFQMELSKYLSAEFKEELAVIREGFDEAGLEIADSTATNDNGDHVEASCVNVVHVYKKLMCPKMHYTKGDQINYKKFLGDNFQGSLQMHFERTCSGTRHDIITDVTVPIIALYAILSFTRMMACLRVMAIFDVAIVKPH